ncbi:MAG: DUF2599 domain-containing protein [Rhodoglobus sp.]
MSENADSAAMDVLANVAKVATDERGRAAIDVTVSGVDVTVPTDPTDSISLAPEGRTGVEISLPFADSAQNAETITDGIVSFDNGNGSITAPVVKEDGSVQINTIIKVVSAPTRYSYEIDVPAGGRLESLEGGTIAVVDSSGEFIAGVAAAWARDARGKDIPTRFEIDGTTLTQIVDHQSVDVSYPVTADPWMGFDLIDSVWVSTHAGYWAVNVVPTGWGRTHNAAVTHFAHVAELKTKLGEDAWRVDWNNGTIREQFLCHVTGNYFEWGTYNMESFRPAVHWATQLNPWARCNP